MVREAGHRGMPRRVVRAATPDRGPRMPPVLAWALVAMMMSMVAILMSMVAIPVAFAQTGTFNPETPADPATEARLKHLSDELRCLVCQNQTIADSNADLAVDLRRIVRAQILEGKSDADIKNYLVARYGDFVLYRPPMQGNTLLLWIGPFALLGIGLVIWWLVGRPKKALVEAASISDDERTRAKSLLDSADEPR